MQKARSGPLGTELSHLILAALGFYNYGQLNPGELLQRNASAGRNAFEATHPANDSLADVLWENTYWSDSLSPPLCLSQHLFNFYPHLHF